LTVISWGQPALYKRPNRRRALDQNKQKYVAELFKLHLGKLFGHYKDHNLPVEYKKAITNYLREIGNVSVKGFNIII